MVFGTRPLLQRRLSAVLALCAIGAFVSGAGLATPALLPAMVLLALSTFWSPPERLRHGLEVFWRILAVMLAIRAGYHALFLADDVVLPMVDLLLLLLAAETYRVQDGLGDARLYALTFALLVAAAAYRPGSGFALAFVAYVAVLVVSLIAGQLTRLARERGVRPPVLGRPFLLQSAALSSIALLVSLLVFLAFPRVSWGARGAAPLRTVAGFADRVSLLEHGGRISSNPEVVLRVEFPGGVIPPAGQRYWRGRSYDSFDGWAWSRSFTRPQPLIEVDRWPRQRVEQLIYQAPLGDANVLFGLSPPVRIEPRSRIMAYPDQNGDFSYGGPASPVYAAFSVVGQPGPDQLRNAARSSSGGDVFERHRQAILQEAALRPYLRLPPLSSRFYALADSLARSHTTTYDRAVAVRDWLRSSFGYTLDLPRDAASASLEYFLFERRQGHCEYFSTAMAMLLRAMGIPARNVNGFLGGEWNDFGDFLTVTQDQAHSWVEVWFAGYGWVSFDPTPAGAAGGAGGAASLSWLAPLRRLLSGVEHRWGKWVLDYDLEDQGRLLRRATGAWQPPASSPPAPPRVPWGVVLVLVALLAASGALRRSLRGRSGRRRGGRGAAAISREYLRLRRAYAHAGYPPGSPPLTFLADLERAGAPGLEDAASAVRLYTRLRFGPAPVLAEERRQLRQHVRSARRLVGKRGGTAAGGR